MPSLAEWWQNETFIPLDWSPPPQAPVPRPRRWMRWLTASVMLVLVATSTGLGWLAWTEHRIAQSDQATVRLQAARLDTLQSQIASSGRQLTSASTVAGELQACIDANGKASSDFFGFLTGSDHKAATICSTAESDYQQLLSSGGSAH